MSISPPVSSCEFDVINKLTEHAVRDALHSNPLLKRNELLSQPPVKALVQLVEQQARAAFDHPRVFFNEHTDEEYDNKPYWSLDEAVSLSAGFDPFYFGPNPRLYAPKLRNHHTRLKSIATRAMHAHAFPVTVMDGRYFVEPSSFVTWALAAHLVDDFTVAFFEDIEFRPERISDADSRRESLRVTPLG